MPVDNVQVMTPGSAVANQLQEILTARRAQQQQELVNALTAKNYEQTWLDQQKRQELAQRQFEESQRVNEASIAQANAATAASNAQRISQQLDETAPDSPMSNLPVELQNAARARGYNKQLPMLGPLDEGEEEQFADVFSGGPTLQKTLTNQRIAQDQITALMNDPSMAPMLENNPQLAALLAARARGVDGDLPFPRMVYGMNAETGGMAPGRRVNPNDTVLSFNPRDPNSRVVPVGQGMGTDAAGNTVPMYSFIKDGKLVTEAAPVPEGITTDPSQWFGRFTPRAAGSQRASQLANVGILRDVARTASNRKIRPEEKSAMYKQAGTAYLSSATFPNKVAKIAAQYIVDELDRVGDMAWKTQSPAEMVARASADPEFKGLSPTDWQDVRDVLNELHKLKTDTFTLEE